MTIMRTSYEAVIYTCAHSVFFSALVTAQEALYKKEKQTYLSMFHTLSFVLDLKSNVALIFGLFS